MRYKKLTQCVNAFKKLMLQQLYFYAYACVASIMPKRKVV